MDRRQKKTRNAIFRALTDLLATRDFSHITVSDIIERADVGRATFYAHFETKDFLLKELCQELFCHLFDAEKGTPHRHIFECDTSDSVFVHLFTHLQKNDNHILNLLTSPNNSLFLEYFRKNLDVLILENQDLFAARRSHLLPERFWLDHIASVLIETLRWWVKNGLKESPETIAQYFFLAV